MKRIGKKSVVVGLLAVVSAAAIWTTAKRAVAGYKEEDDVTINDQNRTANGALGTVRASGSRISFVALQVYSFDNGNFFIAAAAKTGGNSPIRRDCVSWNDQALLAAVNSAKSDSFVEFGWNTDGSCHYIYTLNGSYLAPKVP